MPQPTRESARILDRCGNWAWVLKNELSQERDVIASYFPHASQRGPSMQTLQHDLVSRVLRSGRPWEGWLTRYFQQYASADKVSIDVGANIGAHTSSLARWSYQVVALEPQRDAYECLVANTSKTPRVMTIRAAASRHPGSGSMNHSTDNRGASRLVRGPGDEAVDVIRLDDLRLERSVGLMKIDVEGHERDVLLGAQRILTTDRPVILLEDSSRARLILKDIGYEVRRISLKDFLCLPQPAGHKGTDPSQRDATGSSATPAR